MKWKAGRNSGLRCLHGESHPDSRVVPSQNNGNRPEVLCCVPDFSSLTWGIGWEPPNPENQSGTISSWEKLRVALPCQRLTVPHSCSTFSVPLVKVRTGEMGDVQFNWYLCFMS